VVLEGRQRRLPSDPHAALRHPGQDDGEVAQPWVGRRADDDLGDLAAGDLIVANDVSTDEILPAGERVLPYRSNIPKLAEFAFTRIDESYPARALATRDRGGHIVVGGANYGQGSSREHAVLAPRYLGLRAVLAVSFARIHWQNLASFGVLTLEFADANDYGRVDQDDVLVLEGIRWAIASGTVVRVRNVTRGEEFVARHGLSSRQVEQLLAGGLIPWLRDPAAVAVM
jgi:aconitate hydratase